MRKVKVHKHEFLKVKEGTEAIIKVHEELHEKMMKRPEYSDEVKASMTRAHEKNIKKLRGLS